VAILFDVSRQVGIEMLNVSRQIGIHIRHSLLFLLSRFNNILPATLNINCRVTRINHQLGVFDNPAIIVIAVIGSDQYRVVTL